MFLLGNLQDHGPRLTDHPNSGNYRCVEMGGEVRGVFALLRRGNILAQFANGFSFPEVVLESCRGEPIAIQGFVGAWVAVKELLDLHLAREPDVSVASQSREILFSLEVGRVVGREADPRIRFLRAGDVAEWEICHRAFMEEIGFPVQGSIETRRKLFEERAVADCWWGLYDGARLVSMATFNAKIPGMAQVGGVFTLPERRRQGLSRAVMARVIEDAKRVHGADTLILFTDEKNLAAQALYRGLGFREIGEFGIVFVRAAAFKS